MHFFNTTAPASWFAPALTLQFAQMSARISSRRSMSCAQQAELKIGLRSLPLECNAQNRRPSSGESTSKNAKKITPETSGIAQDENNEGVKVLSFSCRQAQQVLSTKLPAAQQVLPPFMSTRCL